MVFNPDPNTPEESIVFTNRNTTSYENVSYACMDVKPVDSHKHLGYVLDSKLNYSKHLDKKIRKANQCIGVIDLFTDSDAIFEKSIPQCIMGYPGYMCIRREVNKL